MSKVKNNTPKAAEKGGFCAYIGPSIIGVIQEGTIYESDRDKTIKALKDTIERFPLIASLIVADAELAKSLNAIKTPGNLLYVNYKKLASGKKK
jgi:hypothetical protein